MFQKVKGNVLPGGEVGNNRIPGTTQLTATMLIALLLFALPVAVYADHDDSVYRMRFLPQVIAQSYFPAGENYLIPVDARTESLVEQARSYEAAGNYRQAQRYYSTALRRAADPAVPYIAFVLCTLEERSAEAIDCMKNLVEAYPRFPLIDAVRFELAFRLFLLGKPQESLRYLALVEENETAGAPIFTPSALYFAGIIEADDGQPEAALALFERALVSMNTTGGQDYVNIYPGLYLEMAKAMLQLGSYEQSEKLLKVIYGTSPLAAEQSEALWYLGEVYAAQTQWALAHASYAALLAQFGATPFAPKAQKKLEGIDKGDYENLTIEPLYDESLLSGHYGSEEEAVDDSVNETTAAGAYALQLGSFSREENAQSYVEQLQNLDFPAFLVQAQVEERSFYRVRVGFYETREEAEAVLRTLRELGYSGYILEER